MGLGGTVQCKTVLPVTRQQRDDSITLKGRTMSLEDKVSA